MNSPSLHHNHKHPTKQTTTVNGIGMYESWKRNFKTPFHAMLDIIDNAIDAALEDERIDKHFVGRVEIYEKKIEYNDRQTARFFRKLERERQKNNGMNDHNDSRGKEGEGGGGGNESSDDEVKENDPDPVVQMLQQMEKKKKEEMDNQIDSKRYSELVVVNNSLHEICPLKEILEIHKSAKGKAGTHKSEAIGENGIGKNCLFIFVCFLEMVYAVLFYYNYWVDVDPNIPISKNIDNIISLPSFLSFQV